METGQIIWIVVIAVVVLAVLGLVAMMASRRRAEQHRHEAATLREEARSHAGGLEESDRHAREAAAEAARKRAEAERAEAEAAEAREGHEHERAQVEDRVREADRLDPDVDHRSKDYRPGTPGTAAAADPAATPADPSVAAPPSADPVPPSQGTDARAAEDPAHASPEAHPDDPDGPTQGGSHRA